MCFPPLSDEEKRFAFTEKGNEWFWSATCITTLLRIPLLETTDGPEHATHA